MFVGVLLCLRSNASQDDDLEPEELWLNTWTLEVPREGDWYRVFHPSTRRPAVLATGPGTAIDSCTFQVRETYWYWSRLAVEATLRFPDLASLRTARGELVARCGFIDMDDMYDIDESDPLGRDTWRSMQFSVTVSSGLLSPEPGRVYGTLSRAIRLPFVPSRGIGLHLPRRRRRDRWPWVAHHEPFCDLFGFDVMDTTPAAGGGVVHAEVVTRATLDPLRYLYLASRVLGAVATAPDGTVLYDPGWPDDYPREPTAEPGDLLQVPLPDGRFGYLHYLADTTYLGPLVSVLDCVSSAPVPSADLQVVPGRVGPLHAAVLHGTATGRWKVIGRRLVEDPGVVPLRLFVPPLGPGESGDAFVNPMRGYVHEIPGAEWGWRVQRGHDQTAIGARLPGEYRHLEMAWHWPCEDLEHRIMTGTSPHLERMREFE